MDKSRPASSRNTSKARTPTCAKFLVQKAAFFGTAKKILTVTQDSILIDNLNNDAKQREEIPFQELTSIKRSPVYDAEFTLVSRKSEAPPIFCASRSRCLADIYIAWDKFIEQESPHLGSNNFLKFEVSKVVIPDNHDFYIEVDLFIYRSHMELVNKSLHDPSKLEKQYIEIKNPEFVVGSVTVIPFYSIGTIYKTHKGIVIEMKDSGAQHRLLFYDLEKTNKVINSIQNNYREYVGAQVDVSTEEFDEGLVPDYVSPKVYKLFFFNTKVYKIIESGHFLPIEIALSDDYLIEIDMNTGLVIQKLELSGVKHVVRLVPGLTGVQVVFYDSTTVMYVPLNQERGLLASNIFTLASWKKADNVSATLQDEFIHGAVPNNRVQVHGWLEEGLVEPDYEAELIKRFTNSVSDDQLFQILHEFNVNATLKNYNDGDPKPLQILINLFCKNTKIILSKEFMAFWETYQVYLTHLYPFDFEGQPLGEEERLKTISECEEKFRQINDKFQTRQAEKGTTMTLNTQTVPLILYRTEELLKGITLLVSSKGLFKEIANNKLDQYRYENFLIETARLIDSPFSPLSHLAGNLFRAFAHFLTVAERRNESINKKFLLTSRVKLIQTISETLAKRVLIKHNDSKNHESFYILSILACLKILKTFIYDRKDTTNPEDFQMILEVISSPYYFAMFNFLSRYRSVAIVYDTTIIINSFFQNCTTRDLYKSYQEKFLNNSTLILLHIELVLSSLSVLQRKISVVLLSHLFLENPSACGLVCRIFPKNLFRKVDFMSNDISKWTLAQWEQFFSLASKNFDTATEQWNEDCRGELLSKLKKIDQDINSRFNWCPQNRIHELFDPTFNHSGEFLLNIRWNHEELEMHYEVLQHKILVWKYYLTNLLEDSETPKFSVPVVNPAKLWNELNIKFTGTHEPSEMKLILKVMVLLYKEHHAQVKDLNTMQYWLRCLTNPEFRHCRYLILQLFYTALSVEDIAVIRFNVKKFTDVGGIKVLSDVLSSLYFEEDHINLSEEQLEELRNKSPEDMDYNYTKLDIKKQAYTPSLEKSAMILLIINIYKCILYRPIDKTLVLDEKLLYPIPTAKYQIIEQSTVRCLMDVLLLSDDDLALHVLDFFTEYLCDKFTFRSLTDDTPLFEFLLVNMTPKTTQARFNLALKIYNRISDEIFPEVNPIKTYSSFVFTSASPQLVSDAFDMFPLFKYFPKHLIYRLITVGAEDVSKIFWSDSHETPEIIWNSQMKELLIERINEKVQPFKHELVKFSENNKLSSKDNMPIYTGGSPEVVYQNVLDEVKVGPMMLRVWIQRSFYNFELPQDAVTIFIEKLSTLLKEYATIQIPQATHKQLEDLLIVLKAHAKAIKVYSLTRYTCFKEVIGILSYFSTRLSEEDLTQFHQDILAEMSHFILVLCRILYRAIKLDKSENSSIFLENNGLQALLSIIQSMIRKISVNPQPEHHEYYTNLVLSYHDLKIINLAVRMTQRLFVCYPAKFISLDAEKKLEIFLDLQVFTKIPLTLFELIKTQRENPSENLTKRNGTEIFDAAIIEEEQQQYHPGSVSIFEVITTEPHTSSADVYITKIFMFVKNLIDLFSGLSLKIEFSTSFIQSGLNWRLLEFLTYYGEHDPSEDKVHKVNYQSILMNVEKICNVFRNNVIYSNEAYIWKITGGFTSSRGVGIITSKEKSPKLIQSLNKIENNDKMILANFHECVMILLGKHILEMLLSDYFEPVIAPHEREIQNIGGFLRVFSTSLHDPATLWNAETRQELKALLIQQIFDINNSHGKLYLNQIEKFRYTLHQKHLIIYDVFVSLYNKTPEWKIANPPQFLLKTMKNVADLWQTLQDLDNDELLRQDEANLSSTLFNLNEATAAICNVITYHGFEDVLLSEESLTQLGIFLKEHQFANIKDPLLATLKSTCLDIFLNLSKKLSGSLKILENTSILKNTIGLLRSNTKESSVLNQKIIKIVRNVAHEDSLKRALINYGFLVFLLESSLKTEIHPGVYRKDVFDFILKVVKNLPVNHILNKLLLTLFPENIQELIYGTESSDSILETLDQGYDTPKIMWTKMMRHEVLLLLSSESDSIQEKWDSYNAKEIRITDNLVFWSELHNLTPPVFPDLSENICIDNIYLKNFNKDPNFDSHDNIMVFIDDVANFTANIYGDFLKMVAEYENAKKTEDENAMSIENQKQLDKLSYQMVTLLTALGLSLDKLMFHIKEKERTESMKELYQQKESIKELVSHLPAPAEQKLSVILEPRGSIVQDPILIMSENAVTLIMRSLELFDHLKAHLHILSTELQLIYLISDNERGFTLLRSHDIISIITKLLKVLTGDQNNNPFTFVEEKLILYILIKMLLKDQLLVADAIEQCVLPLKQLLLSNKTYLRPLVENALSILIRDPKKGKDIFNELNHEQEIISVEVIHNCNPRLALQNVWKTFTNPYKSDNVLNLLVEKSPDSNVTYPAISEYSVVSVPHPKPENAKAEQVIKQYMVKIVNENSESAECSHLQ